MSRVRANSLTDKAGYGAPSFPYGAVSAGVITATSFDGAVAGVSELGTNCNGTNLTLSGNLQVDGTQTIIHTDVLDVKDKTVGIGSTHPASNTTADGCGIEVYGGNDGNKNLTWERDTGTWTFNTGQKVAGVTETVGAGVTYMDGSALVLELDVNAATIYTHTCVADVGIVSFKNMPADTGKSNASTITVIYTQGTTAMGNSTTAAGIGTNVTVRGYEDGALVAGITTSVLTGSGTTMTLTETGGQRDFVSYLVHYTGGTNTTASSYQIYATKNGGYSQST